MGNNRYKFGRYLEYRAMDALSEMGYSTVRSAGSKGAFDIVAYNGDHVRFIQIKGASKSGQSYRSDLDKMVKTVVPHNASIELWVYERNSGWAKIVVLKGCEGLKFPIDSVLFVENQ